MGYTRCFRSVVVASDAKGAGIGGALTRRVLEEARGRGASTVYLLTTTAIRADVPAALQASKEFHGACPASAIVMRRDLCSDGGLANVD